MKIKGELGKNDQNNHTHRNVIMKPITMHDYYMQIRINFQETIVESYMTVV